LWRGTNLLIGCALFAEKRIIIECWHSAFDLLLAALSPQRQAKKGIIHNFVCLPHSYTWTHTHKLHAISRASLGTNFCFGQEKGKFAKTTFLNLREWPPRSSSG
jgi:hypothetical protein